MKQYEKYYHTFQGVSWWVNIAPRRFFLEYRDRRKIYTYQMT